MRSPARCRPGHPALRLQSDERLVELAAGGFEPAFEVLVGRHRGALMGYSCRVLAADRAEDVVQQTFIRAHEAIANGHAPDRLRPWLFRVAHNAALDSLKDRALQHTELDEGLNGVERPDQAYDRGERLRDVLAAVQALPSRQRDAIVLRELEGRSYEEIAREMHVTGGAVRQLLMRARTTVRAACSALTPYSVIHRVPWAGSEPVTARVAEVVGGAGTPVVVAQVCAVAIVTCVGGGGVAERERPTARAEADRAGLAERALAPAEPLLAAPALASSPATAAPARTVPRLVPPGELPKATDRLRATVPVADRQDEQRRSDPSAKPPQSKPPVKPREPSYEYAYPVGLADPQACLQRRARSSCDALEEDPQSEPDAGKPATPPPAAGAPPADQAPPADPAPAAPPPSVPPASEPPPSNPPPANPPPSGSPPSAAARS